MGEIDARRAPVIDGYGLLLLVPPALAVPAAWAGSRATKRSAAKIDREREALRNALQVNKEREMTPESAHPSRGFGAWWGYRFR